MHPPCIHPNTFVEQDWLGRVVAVCDGCGAVTEVCRDGAWSPVPVAEFDDWSESDAAEFVGPGGDRWWDEPMPLDMTTVSDAA
jgi:hypothetical protein